MNTVSTMDNVLSVISDWDGNGVVVRHDRPTGTWIFIALHSSVLGRPTGGTRMKVYPELADAARDAVRLAEGMTHKWAGIELASGESVGCGGGKAVLAVPRPLEADEREGLLLRYGELLESLLGAFATGPDLGAGPDAMEVVARRTQWVHGVEKGGASFDPGPFTAHGVKAGIHASLEHVFGGRDLAGRIILVEGLGDVGEPLARSLAAEGATVLLADLDHDKAEHLAREMGTTAVPAREVAQVPCDVYAPCAVGATLNERTVPRLQCRIVAGSANNQLHEEADAERLHERGIVYAPDYIINAGGAMSLALMNAGISGHDAIFERVAGIEKSIAEVLREAGENGVSPLAAARTRVERVLDNPSRG